VNTLPISAVVVARNEGHLLSRCLESIRFCEELIVVDLESEDDTAEVAEQCGARVIRHPVVTAVEPVRRDSVGEAKRPWVLAIDPDEVVDPALAADLAALLDTLPSTVAIVSVPWQFYFRDAPLRGTVWGDLNEKPISCIGIESSSLPTCTAALTRSRGSRRTCCPRQVATSCTITG
jgi:glycosyltransferase involved in cell wall biosynthesis